MAGVPGVLLDHVQKHVPHAGGTPIPPSELRSAVHTPVPQHAGYDLAGSLHRGSPQYVNILRVILRPGPEADLHARLLEGRTAMVERIMVDLDGKVHLGVTIDDDPGQDLLRETGRFLYFFPPEVEVIST